jgi:hypothetical protein
MTTQEKLQQRLDSVRDYVIDSCKDAGFSDEQTVMVKLIAYGAIGFYNSFYLGEDDETRC